MCFMHDTEFTSFGDLSDFDQGWVTGIIDGEGSFILRLKPSSRQGQYIVDMSVQVTSTDFDIIDRLHYLIGGRIYGPTQKGKNKPCWSWRIYKRDDVVALCSDLIPYLSERRAARAEELCEAYFKYSTRRTKTAA